MRLPWGVTLFGAKSCVKGDGGKRSFNSTNTVEHLAVCPFSSPHEPSRCYSMDLCALPHVMLTLVFTPHNALLDKALYRTVAFCSNAHAGPKWTCRSKWTKNSGSGSSNSMVPSKCQKNEGFPCCGKMANWTELKRQKTHAENQKQVGGLSSAFLTGDDTSRRAFSFKPLMI
jgi:hypothetical protein